MKVGLSLNMENNKFARIVNNLITALILKEILAHLTRL